MKLFRSNFAHKFICRERTSKALHPLPFRFQEREHVELETEDALPDSKEMDFTNRLGLTNFFGNGESMSFYTLVADLVRGSKSPRFHHLLLQSLGNSDHFEASVHSRNICECLFAFVL